MTQWYRSRQLESGPNAGKWHYTCSNTSGSSVYPVGLCADGCPGHDSPDDAQRHYAEGKAAGEIRERDAAEEQRKCAECGAWTQHRAMLWTETHMDEAAICATHDVRAHLRKVLFARYEISETP